MPDSPKDQTQRYDYSTVTGRVFASRLGPFFSIAAAEEHYQTHAPEAEKRLTAVAEALKEALSAHSCEVCAENTELFVTAGGKPWSRQVFS